MTSAGSGSSSKGSWWLVPALAVLLAILLLGRCGTGSSSSGVAATSLPAVAITPLAGRATPAPPGSTTPIRMTITAATLTAAAPVPAGPASTEAAPRPVTPGDTVTASTTVTASATVTTTTTVTATAVAGPPAPGTGVDPGELTANGTSLLPVAQAAPEGTLTRYAGQTVVAHRVLVQSAPVDKGFWVGTSANNRIYVELVGHGLVYPHPIRAGDRVNFVGQLVANTPCFLNSTGLAVADGAGLLAAQRAHIAIPMSGVSFAD